MTELENIDDSYFECKVNGLNTKCVTVNNGLFHPKNITSDLPEGVHVCSMKEARSRYSDIFECHYDKVRRSSDVSENNDAADGVFIYLSAGVELEQPLQILNTLGSETSFSGLQRNLVVLGKGARLTMLVCDHTLSGVEFDINNLTECVLDDGAALDYYEVQNQHAATRFENKLLVSEGRASLLDAMMITLYGGEIRNHIHVALNKSDADCNLRGVYILDKKQKVYNFTYVDHRAPHCSSHEHFKGVLDDAAFADFMGCVRVRPDAQKTDSYQANNNLLLTPFAKVHTSPQLIIDADDVKCSHGATVGQMNEEALFYLRSRGVGADEAKLMMMFGFAHDIIGKIKLQPLREEIDRLIDKRFRGEFSKCHNCTMNCNK
ncbi:MAG: SufD family Fe-S cluster assembly protein [Culturomica sp.]|jgi:Fe-S cluster assembly protein SufD|nr:SufD family Fe-S cluster assembly protein [Culturomica sp.]